MSLANYPEIRRSKNIVFDFDDVMVSTFKKVLGHYNYIVGGKQLSYDEITHFHLNKISGLEHLSNQYCKDLFDDLLMDQSFHRSLEFIKTYLDISGYLKDQGHELHIGTARPKYLEENTIDLFDHHNIGSLFSSYNFLGHKRDGKDITKSSLCKELGASIAFEDGPHNIEALILDQITSFAPFRPRNKTLTTGNGLIMLGDEDKEDILTKFKEIYQATH